MARKDITQIYAESPKTYDQFTDQDYFYFATGGADAATTLAELRKKFQGSASENFSSTITADKNKNIGTYNLANGDLTLNMAASGNIPGVVVTLKIFADGVHAVFIGSGFDADGLIGITSGQVLAAGNYIVRIRHEVNGANIELPSNNGGDYQALSSTVNGHTSEIANKVDKLSGKGLSTNDFDVNYKAQLDNAPANINNTFAAKADLVGGKVPSNQLPDQTDSQYLGGWNATTNTPTVADNVGTNGQFYIVDTGGTLNLGSGNKTFVTGGKAYHNGTIWEPKDPVDAVASVAGKTGAVTLAKADVGLPLVENKTGAQIRAELVEAEVPAEIARTASIPTTLAALSTDTNNQRVSTTEKAQWNAGTGIVGGSAESPSTTWNHTNDIARVTLAANLVITDVAANMPTGPSIKYFTHGAYAVTVSLAGIESVSGFVSRNGENKIIVDNIGTMASPVYRVTDGFKAYGSSAGGSLTADPLTIASVDVLQLFTTGKQVKAAPGANKFDRPTYVAVRIDYMGTPYATNTTLNLMSGNTVLGTCNCLGATSGALPFVFILNTNVPELNQPLTIKAATGNPISGNSDIGIIVHYEVVDLSQFAFVTYENKTLGVVTDFSSILSSTTIRPRSQPVSPEGDCWIDSISVRHSTASGNIQVGVYGDSSLSPASRLAVSAIEDASTTGFETTTHNLTTPLFVPKGTVVWLAYVIDGTTTIYYSDFGTSALATASGSTLPNPFGAYGSGTLAYSIYANVRYNPATYDYILNEDFTNWAAGLPVGWALNNTTDGSNFVEEHANGLRFVTAVLANFGITNDCLVNGQVYFMEVETYSITTLGIDPYTGAKICSIRQAGKRMTRFVASGTLYKLLRPGAAADCVIGRVKIWQ
jgi:hypothetical protein